LTFAGGEVPPLTFAGGEVPPRDDPPPARAITARC
jgi:hypothetical protein